jgi:16S rRNA (guanine(966)-N(2))-methyltransferase RsmD
MRPTPDRLRQALFNVLAPRIVGATFLDAYAGSGSVGIEALSRGVNRAIFVEKNPAAARLIADNLAALGIADRATVVEGPARPALERLSADIVFLDPPYALDREYKAALQALSVRPPPLTLVQHASRVSMPERVGRIRRVRVLRHGDNAVSFFEPLEDLIPATKS